jgi:hypothetical protein
MRVGGAERSGRGGWLVSVFMFVWFVSLWKGHKVDKVCAVSWIAGSGDGDLCFAGARVMEGVCACVWDCMGLYCVGGFG